jgi:hypothetical protein
MNPYAPTASEDAAFSRTDRAFWVAIQYGLLAYIVALATFCLLGCGLWILTSLIDWLRYGRSLTFWSWWFENANQLVAPPLLIALTSFLFFATRKRLKPISAFVILLVAGIAFQFLLDFLNLDSPRYLKGVDPLFYPVEIWGFLVPYVSVTVLLVVYYNSFHRMPQDEHLNVRPPDLALDHLNTHGDKSIRSADPS